VHQVGEQPKLFLYELGSVKSPHVRLPAVPSLRTFDAAAESLWFVMLYSIQGNVMLYGIQGNVMLYRIQGSVMLYSIQGNVMLYSMQVNVMLYSIQVNEDLHVSW